MANLYGAYKAGRKVMTAAYETNKKRMGGGTSSSTSTMYTGSGVLGGSAAGSVKGGTTKTKILAEVGTAKKEFNSNVQSEKKSFTAELGDALKTKFETFSTGGE